MFNIIVYNNLAGKGKGELTARKIADLLCRLGQECQLFSNDSKPQFYDFLIKNNFDENNTRIIVVGGDGTLSTIINAVKKSNHDYPIAIYPGGTANDFSVFSKIPKNLKSFVSFIVDSQPSRLDLINANGEYAIHAVGSGNFTNAYETFSPKLKKKIGKFAYYTKCIGRAFKYESAFIDIVIGDKTLHENLMFFYVVNAEVVGGFRHFSPQTNSKDGELELIGFRKCGFFPFLFLFVKMLFGKHLKNKYVLYLKSNKFEFKNIENKSFFNALDIDGNLVNKPPSNIKVEKESILIYTNKGED